jgi:hypothetical protein
VKHYFHTKAQAPTTAPAESFSSTVLHKYRLLFCRAATFNSSGETIASYQGVRAPFSYQSSGSNNITGQLFFNSAAQVDCFSEGLPHKKVQVKRLQVTGSECTIFIPKLRLQQHQRRAFLQQCYTSRLHS